MGSPPALLGTTSGPSSGAIIVSGSSTLVQTCVVTRLPQPKIELSAMSAPEVIQVADLDFHESRTASPRRSRRIRRSSLIL
jgi:hypothetical protein